MPLLHPKLFGELLPAQQRRCIRYSLPGRADCGQPLRDAAMVEANELGKTVSSMADFAPERLLDEAVHDRYVRNIARYCQSQAQEREKLRDFLTRGAAE